MRAFAELFMAIDQTTKKEATKAAKNPTPKSVFRFLEMKTKRWVDSMGLEEGM